MVTFVILQHVIPSSVMIPLFVIPMVLARHSIIVLAKATTLVLNATFINVTEFSETTLKFVQEEDPVSITMIATVLQITMVASAILQHVVASLVPILLCAPPMVNAALLTTALVLPITMVQIVKITNVIVLIARHQMSALHMEHALPSINARAVMDGQALLVILLHATVSCTTRVRFVQDVAIVLGLILAIALQIIMVTSAT